MDKNNLGDNQAHTNSHDLTFDQSVSILIGIVIIIVVIVVIIIINGIVTNYCSIIVQLCQFSFQLAPN